MKWPILAQILKGVITAPAPITNFINFFPAHFREGIDAAFAWPNGSNDDLQIFFFKGKEYVKVDFNVPNNSFTNPQPATSGGWGGVFTNHFTEGIDAALYYPASNKVYFFRGNKYIRYDASTGSIDQGYPLPSNDPQNWGNLFDDWSCIDPQANITCSMSYKIPDNSCSDANEVEFDINGIQPTVLGTNIQVENVVIYIEHPFVSDLTLTLISPSGVEVVLADGVGRNGSNFGTSCNGPDLTVFSRTASQSITQGSAPFKGEFRPQGNLDDFHDGSNPNGIWKLRMCDNADDDVGTLIGFRLSLTRITTGIEDVVEKGIGMTVAPNPSQGRISVSLAQAQPQDLNFDVLDVAGKVVYHYEQARAGSHFETSFDLSHLPNGIFFLRARSGTLVTTERFLIQK